MISHLLPLPLVLASPPLRAHCPTPPRLSRPPPYPRAAALLTWFSGAALSAAGRRVGLGCVQTKGARCRASVSAPPAAQMGMDLYAQVEPYDTGFLKVSDVHSIYYEQSGNPQGHPVVFLHGGPGAGTSPGNRRFFDPEFYRIVLFDQVFGGSWGSTLALAYSQTHPDKATWEPFRDFIPEEERNCFIAAYNKRLTSSDPTIQAFARIENHYFVNKGFLPSDSYLLDNVDKIRHIKAFIVQGRYDVCCPMMSAWDLHKAWPEAEFKVKMLQPFFQIPPYVVPDAGHSANEVGIAAELRSATEKLRDMLK
nr:unnamed protein product [Digitaria exilis]